MAKFEDVEVRINEVFEIVEGIAAEATGISADVTWLHEQLQHGADGMTSEQEAKIVGRLIALKDRVEAVKAVASAVNASTPEPDPSPEGEQLVIVPVPISTPDPDADLKAQFPKGAFTEDLDN